ncbi:hypothetical protein HMF7854_03950 [Sphingomonas ginkgonis]|uniref:ATP-grasp domain-containing protein n=1 Tax=Sphingomonas ginkgonis TaxID=2315330 RepID=A0A429V858_9SPHN|nr:hypothetical protein [Sphingomonas ginkgonis]RST30072.1 hypothetical protein HMF7854_03950 [Sphingomonas ginkgonis]
MRILFLTPAPDYPEAFDWAYRRQGAALVEAGATLETRPWTAAGDLAEFDLVLPILAWGYNRRYAEWLAFLDRAEADRAPLLNAPRLLRWNSDKIYLAELGRRGIPSVATIAVDTLGDADLAAARAQFGTEALVVKPPVSAGADGTFRIRAGETTPAAVAGQRMLVQPYLKAITSSGEVSLFYFGGEFSHAIVKLPREGDFRVQPTWGGHERTIAPPPAAEALAVQALAACPDQPLYARVDMVDVGAGEWRIMELELIEPALFLDHAADLGRGFAQAVLSAAERASEQPLA